MTAVALVLLAVGCGGNEMSRTQLSPSLLLEQLEDETAALEELLDSYNDPDGPLRQDSGSAAYLSMGAEHLGGLMHAVEDLSMCAHGGVALDVQDLLSLAGALEDELVFHAAQLGDATSVDARVAAADDHVARVASVLQQLQESRGEIEAELDDIRCPGHGHDEHDPGTSENPDSFN